MNYSNIEECTLKFDRDESNLSEYVYNSNPRTLLRNQGEYLSFKKPVDTVFGGQSEAQILHGPKNFIFTGKQFGIVQMKKLRPVDELVGLLFVYREQWVSQGVQEYIINLKKTNVGDTDLFEDSMDFIVKEIARFIERVDLVEFGNMLLHILCSKQ